MRVRPHQGRKAILALPIMATAASEFAKQGSLAMVLRGLD
jgi:hypothetical protein